MLQIEQAAGSSTSGLGMQDDHEPGARLASRPLFSDKGALCVAGQGCARPVLAPGKLQSYYLGYLITRAFLFWL